MLVFPKTNSLLISIIFLSWVRLCYAQEIVKSTQIQSVNKLYLLTSDGKSYFPESVSFFVDTSTQLTLAEVEKKNFTVYTKQSQKELLPSKLSWKDVIWVKVTIQNQLIVPGSWELHTGKASYIDVYIPQPDGKIVHKKSGYYRKNSEKEEIRDKEHAVLLDLTPQQSSLTLYVRYQNALKIGMTPKLLLQPVHSWQEYIIERNLIEGVAQGILLVWFLYNLLLFLSTSEKAYLYYSLYILAMVFFYLNVYNLGKEFVFGEYPYISDFNWASIQLVVIFFLLFLNYFLDFKSNFPKKHVNFLILIWTNVAWAIGGSLFLLITKNLQVIFIIHRYFNFIQFANILILLFLLLLSKVKGVKLLIWGTLPVFLGGMWDILFRDTSDLTKVHINYLQIGAIFQLIAFSISIGNKLKEEEKAKRESQERLIEQLQENEKLKDKLNKELEVKVIERTQELRKSNEELKEMNLQLQTVLGTVAKQKEEIEVQKEFLSHQTQQLQVKNEKLSELNHEKARLFSIIAHDLKAPLNALRGLLFVFENDLATEEELKNFIPEVSKDIGYTANLFSNLLSWAKSQMEGTEVRPEKIDLQAITGETIDLLKIQADKKQISLYNEIEDPVEAYADKEMITLVIRNLVSNAIKFTLNGGKVVVKCQIKQTMAQIIIQDNGIGMNRESLQRLFGTEHYTLRGTDNEKGTGLGLVLSKDFVERNNGTIWVESQEGDGTTFYFTVPLFASIDNGTWNIN
jgi:signal transduction histidine kinase